MCVKFEHAWTVVMRFLNMGEYLSLRRGLPNEFQKLVFYPIFFLLIMDSSHKNGIHSQLCENLHLTDRMPKLVKLPSHSWQIFFTELLHNEGVSNLVIKDHILKRRTCFIMARPSAVNKFKLTILDKLSNLLLFLRIL